jgi:hypothetical protein
MHGFLQDFCSCKSTLVALALLVGSVAQAELKYRFVNYPGLQSGGILDGSISLPDDFLGRDPMSTPIVEPFGSGFEWSAISSAGVHISVARDALFKSVLVIVGSVSVTESAIILSPPPAFHTGTLSLQENFYADGFLVGRRSLTYTLSEDPLLNLFTANEFVTHANGSETVTVLWRTVPSASFIASSGWVIATRVPEPSALILLLTIAMAFSPPR